MQRKGETCDLHARENSGRVAVVPWQGRHLALVLRGAGGGVIDRQLCRLLLLLPDLLLNKNELLQHRLQEATESRTNVTVLFPRPFCMLDLCKRICNRLHSPFPWWASRPNVKMFNIEMVHARDQKNPWEIHWQKRVNVNTAIQEQSNSLRLTFLSAFSGPWLSAGGSAGSSEDSGKHKAKVI